MEEVNKKVMNALANSNERLEAELKETKLDNEILKKDLEEARKAAAIIVDDADDDKPFREYTEKIAHLEAQLAESVSEVARLRAGKQKTIGLHAQINTLKEEVRELEESQATLDQDRLKWKQKFQEAQGGHEIADSRQTLRMRELLAERDALEQRLELSLHHASVSRPLEETSEGTEKGFDLASYMERTEESNPDDFPPKRKIKMFRLPEPHFFAQNEFRVTPHTICTGPTSAGLIWPANGELHTCLLVQPAKAWMSYMYGRGYFNTSGWTLEEGSQREFYDEPEEGKGRYWGRYQVVSVGVSKIDASVQSIFKESSSRVQGVADLLVTMALYGAPTSTVDGFTKQLVEALFLDGIFSVSVCEMKRIGFSNELATGLSISSSPSAVGVKRVNGGYAHEEHYHGKRARRVS